MKLKTLKDIEQSASQEIFCNLVKQEAIKWVKRREELRRKEHSGHMLFVDWLKFFDITEEDLKDE